MSSISVYHVIPTGDGWEGKLEDALRASVTGKDKEDVLEKTIGYAKRRMPSQVVVHKADGTVLSEHIYSDDPFRY